VLRYVRLAGDDRPKLFGTCCIQKQNARWHYERSVGVRTVEPIGRETATKLR
jgi:hypothetical protein